MTRFSSRLLRLAGAGSLLALSACGDLLDVQNKNQPETDRVLSSPADVEALIRGSYIQALEPIQASDNINMQLGSVAFENSAMAANFGMIERSAFPRAAIINTSANQFAGEYYEVWAESYAAIRSASDGLARLDLPDFTIGTALADARAEAFGKFVLFFAHANLAITYDQASIYDETVSASTIQPLVDYKAVMTAALGYANEAIATAQANPTISFPSDWFGVEVSSTRFIQIVNSLKARYIMQNARKASDLTAADYTAVITAATAGITTDYSVVDDDDKHDRWMHDYMSFRGAWHQVPYFVSGMADQSGAYQTWMANTNLLTRPAFTIVTPDLRFPQGADLVAQRAAPGKNIRAKTNSTGEGGWIRAERGMWRWSHYLDIRYQAYYNANNTGVALPYIQVKEINLYKAEALWMRNTGTDRADAVAIVNATRVTDGGLSPADLLGTNTSCVPKLPNGTCGGFFEQLKWEKRMQHFMETYGAWYFDSRRWGDLPQYTFLHYPVPARELEVRQLPLYTFGGAADATSAPVGTYGY